MDTDKHGFGRNRLAHLQAERCVLCAFVVKRRYCLMIAPSGSILDGFVDKHISEICTCSFLNDAENHCAHFVCHVTGLNFGLTCFAMSGKGEQGKSANIRVQEVFPRCRSVGTWASKPSY